MGQKLMPTISQTREWQRNNRIRTMMSRRLAAGLEGGHDAQRLFVMTLLWRIRRYYDAHDFEKGDVLLELVDDQLAMEFLHWYFGETV